MNSSQTLPANDAARRIVRHFQAEGFSGISEAMIIRLRLKEGEQASIERAFGQAEKEGAPAPVQQFFEIRPVGYFSDFRSYADARAAIQSDFTTRLRFGVPRIYFDPAPVVIDDVLASSTKYDVLMKLGGNTEGYAFAVFLNDPDYAFLDYLGTHHGNDWEQVMGKLEVTAAALGEDLI